MKIQVELGEDTIEIKKAKPCCIKDCNDYSEFNHRTLALCKKHHNEVKG